MHRLVLLLTALTLTPFSNVLCNSQWQGSLPGGSYTETCQDIGVNGTMLQARCQTKDGDWRQTSIDYRQCGGPIVNDDGRLRCGEGGGGAGYVGLPGGSYAETCHDIRTNGTVLQARCQKRDGSFRKTSIDYRQCGGRVINDDGYLRCGEARGGYGHLGDYDEDDRTGGQQGATPYGAYSQTCRNIRTDGDRLEAECQTRDGDWHGTSLSDFSQCRSAIANDNGNLRCEK
jgi:major membrane immunogen (membrane-anchored lipoprotein)